MNMNDLVFFHFLSYKKDIYLNAIFLCTTVIWVKLLSAIVTMRLIMTDECLL